MGFSKLAIEFAMVSICLLLPAENKVTELVSADTTTLTELWEHKLFYASYLWTALDQTGKGGEVCERQDFLSGSCPNPAPLFSSLPSLPLNFPFLSSRPFFHTLRREQEVNKQTICE